ncbi:hypothetical protein CRG98_049463, partial [Punica granatum]
QRRGVVEEGPHDIIVLKREKGKGNFGEYRQHRVTGPSAIFDELHGDASRNSLIRPVGTPISASSPYPINLLFRTAASIPICGVIARRPPLCPCSISSPSIPTSGS